MVKKFIIVSGNRSLFPELKIPRTTLKYWLSHAREAKILHRDSIYKLALRVQTSWEPSLNYLISFQN